MPRDGFLHRKTISACGSLTFAAFLWGSRAMGGQSEIEWVKIPGGSFLMGNSAPGSGTGDEAPPHRVTLKPFEMANSEVTFKQYRACVEAGVCSPLPQSCAADSFRGDDQPVLCVDWNQARAFSRWAGGRLPSESEWEYAARSAGKDWKYPWGNEDPDCDKAVFGGNGCGRGATWPVCSKPAGNTEQGLCDMAGNIGEWVEDWYHGSYAAAPADGGAWTSPSKTLQGYRGGSWHFDNPLDFQVATSRDISDKNNRCLGIGIRPVRDGPPAKIETAVQWVKIPGGSFLMSSSGAGSSPVERVDVKPFEMAKSEVTFRQYGACVQAGACAPIPESCAAPSFRGEDQPVLCVDLSQARAFARWAGGRLPSESEWEYAARSAGKDWKYPWGQEDITCDRAVFDRNGCGRGATWPVCSKPLGNTAQGLCDMAGNVGEWVERASPSLSARVFRGGAWFAGPEGLRASSRDMSDPAARADEIGFRPVRQRRD